MLKKGVAKEKVEVSSKEFTKKFIKNFILNGLIIGIVIGIINELVGQFITNKIIKEIVYFALTFFAINKIHVAAIKDTFYDSYILGENVRKSKNNVMILFIAIALGDIIWNAISLTKLYTLFGSLGSFYLKSFVVKSIISILLYAIIIVFCRDEIDKECSEYYLENKNYLTKKVIFIIVFAIAVIVGTIFINQGNKSIVQEEKENNSIVSSINKNENNGITNSNNIQNTTVNTLKVSSLNEINCELSNNTITVYPNVKKDYLKSVDGKVEINISSFDTKIQKSNVYNEKTVKDGVILFYNGIEKNYIEKFNMNGESSWKCETASYYKFYNFMEVTDGYFMLGNANSKYIIAKMNMQGNIISVKYIEDNITDITLIESDTNNQKGYLEIMGLNNQGNVVIITYDNEGNQEKVLTTKSNNIACKKVVEKNGNYYGIGENSAENLYTRDTTWLFKIDSVGNEIFKYDIQENNNFNKYIGYNSWLKDISVNNNYIYIITTNDTDVYALDLNGNLVQKFGYDTNRILNQGYHSSVDYVKAKDEGVLIYGTTVGPNNIDMISNDFNFQYRINISNTELFPKSTTVNPIGSSRLVEDMFLDAELYDNSSIIIYQYKFN